MIEYSLEINRSCQSVFNVSQDYDLRLQWDPFPESYTFLKGDVVEKGLHILVKAKNGHSMEVQYVSFNPPKAAAIKMIKGPWFIHAFAGSWLFKETEEGQCKVTFKYNIQGAPSILGFIVTPLLRFIFHHNAKRRLKALKTYIESNL